VRAAVVALMVFTPSPTRVIHASSSAESGPRSSAASASSSSSPFFGPEITTSTSGRVSAKR
jgi:hypothetical protein